MTIKIDAMACAGCDEMLSLLEDCEWPEDETLILCSGCAIDEIVKLREEVDRLHDMVDWQDPKNFED